jgi:hypothetical protein
MALAPAEAQEEQRYFAETGHYLHPYFEVPFDEFGGISVLGYPITDGFIDHRTYHLVQYFENARLESPVRQRGNPPVRLSALGDAMGARNTPSPQGPAAALGEPGCQRDAGSGYSVCHAFLDFYNLHGGQEVLGSPIADYTIEDGRLVQYFENFRLDWRPENPPDRQVVPAALGKMHFARSDLDPALLSPRRGPTDTDGVTMLRPTLSLSKPVAQTSDTQRVQVIVRDQRGFPVSGSAVSLDVYLGGGKRTLLLPLTDANGVTRGEFTFEGQPVGTIIQIEAKAVKGALRAETRDSFPIWW